ncbi:PepSY domain-containing protein, partial [Paenibacillus sp. P22]|uniref:PepSY-associated TM helix domain-containing protein n=1 Tax=Paenibacillus sp. P22 TaxID=483908 RepID=UPI00043315EC
QVFRVLDKLDGSWKDVQRVHAPFGLMKMVCRRRGIPIFTFINKLDREGQSPFDSDGGAGAGARHPFVLIATGLPWSGVLGGQIDRAANATNTNTPPYAYLFSGQPESITVAKDIADNIPWAAENTPVPNSISGGYVRLSMNEIAAIAERQHVLKPYTITMPRGDSGVYSVSTDHVKPGKEVTLHVDPYSGAVLTDVRYQDFGVMAKLITLGIAFHEGRLFGLANQIIGLVTCLGLVLISAGSYVMWRKRKPSGTLGAPRKPKDKRVMIGVLAIMAVLGILMPLVGLSILAILIVDLVLISRIPALRRWLSS